MQKIIFILLALFVVTMATVIYALPKLETESPRLSETPSSTTAFQPSTPSSLSLTRRFLIDQPACPILPSFESEIDEESIQRFRGDLEWATKAKLDQFPP